MESPKRRVLRNFYLNHTTEEDQLNCRNATNNTTTAAAAAANTTSTTTTTTTTINTTNYLLTYLHTYSMEHSPSWEANWFCS